MGIREQIIQETRTKDGRANARCLREVWWEKTPERVFMRSWLVSAYPNESLEDSIRAVENDLEKVPRCGVCNGRVKHHKGNFAKTCSPKCSANSIVVKESRKNTMIEKYGVVFNFQRHDVIEKSFNSNIERLGIDKKIYDYLWDPEWLIEQNHVQKKTMKQIAKEIGCSWDMVQYSFKKFGVEIRTNLETSGFENDVIKEITSYVGNNKVKLNDRTLLHPFEIDILIPEHHVGIECNGIYWHSFYRNGDDRDRLRNHRKVLAAKESGIRLVSLWEDHWEGDKDGILKRLWGILENPWENSCGDLNWGLPLSGEWDIMEPENEKYPGRDELIIVRCGSYKTKTPE